MAAFKGRFPSRREVMLVFAVCVVPIYTWSILAFLDKLPSWLLFLNCWDLVGLIAYALAFALVESVIALLALVFLGAILPAWTFRDRFVAMASLTMLISSVFAIIVHYRPWLMHSFRAVLFGLTVYTLSLMTSHFLVHRYISVEKLLNSVAVRLTVLIYIYLPLSLLGILVVLVRNA